MAQNGTAAHFDLAQGSTAPTNRLYSKLLRRDPADGYHTIITDLATSVDVSADSKVYTFKLRDGVKFHDGTPFTSADVVASMKRQIEPPQGVIPTFKAIMGPITAIDAIDPSTIRITLSKPYFPFLDVLAADGPGKIYSKKTLDENGNDLKKIIAPGTGPFKFNDHKQGEYWLFDKNPDYFDKEIPYADKMRWLHVPIADDRGTAVLTGRADWTSNAGLQTWLEGEKRPDVVKGIAHEGDRPDGCDLQREEEAVGRQAGPQGDPPGLEPSGHERRLCPLRADELQPLGSPWRRLRDARGRDQEDPGLSRGQDRGCGRRQEAAGRSRLSGRHQRGRLHRHPRPLHDQRRHGDAGLDEAAAEH